MNIAPKHIIGDGSFEQTIMATRISKKPAQSLEGLPMKTKHIAAAA